MTIPKFEQLDAFSIIGCPQYGNPGSLCPGTAWDRLSEIRGHYGLKGFPELAFAIEVYPPKFLNNDSKFYYMAGMILEDTPAELRQHLFIKEVPRAYYAVFSVKNNNIDNLKTTFEYAYQKWLPTSSFTLSHRFDLERYKENPERCIDILLPVVDKKDKRQLDVCK